MADVKRRDTCRICRGDTLRPVINLGPAPLANQYKTRGELDRPEPYYPLELYRCTDCGLVQLRDIVPAETLFREYDYVAGQTSESLPEHFVSYAEQVVDTIDMADPFIVGIGSNDGTFLRALQDRGATVLGVDPARNVARIAEERGVETMPRFFTPAVAEDITTERGNADVVVANNVLGHVDALHDVIDGIKMLLREGGSLFFEVQYLPDLLDKTAFDMVYHEHRSYLSVKPLNRLFQEHGMSMVGIDHEPVQGGSIRVHAVNQQDATASSATHMIRDEESSGVYDAETYRGFRSAVHALRQDLCRLLQEEVPDGAAIAGYGAPAKAATLLNFCNIGSEHIRFVTDEIPAKQGKYIPGTRIPITPPEALQERDADHALMLSWNFRDEILSKEAAFLEDGGRFILPIPDPKILE